MRAASSRSGQRCRGPGRARTASARATEPSRSPARTAGGASTDSTSHPLNPAFSAQLQAHKCSHLHSDRRARPTAGPECRHPCGSARDLAGSTPDPRRAWRERAAWSASAHTDPDGRGRSQRRRAPRSRARADRRLEGLPVPSPRRMASASNFRRVSASSPRHPQCRCVHEPGKIIVGPVELPPILTNEKVV